MIGKWIMVLLGAAGLGWAGGKFTEEQLKAKFYFDLGPAELDVSSYPVEQQENYAVFAKTCSQCHTLARAINAPMIKKKDWQRYTARMHLRAKVRPGKEFSKAAAKKLVSFLAYDAVLRKSDRKEEFAARTEELRKLFGEVQAERSRLQIEEDKKKVRPAPPYTGDKP